jgi:(p)ppGpp synthase/HD superfamily hydrolase
MMAVVDDGLRLYAEATTEAIYGHEGQTRRGKDVPYISHPIRVAGLVLKYGGCYKTAAAAVMHDLLEDLPEKFTEDYIRSKYGDFICQIVVECSEVIGLNPPKESWIVVKKRHLVEISSMLTESMLLTAADKLDSLREIFSDYKTLGAELWSRFHASKEDTVWYYNEVYNQLEKSGFNNHIMLSYKEALVELNKLD